MPMQATHSLWCLMVVLQLAEYTEGTRFFCCSRRREGMSYWTGSFSGIKYHQNCAIAEAMENLPNGQHHRVMYYDSQAGSSCFVRCQIAQTIIVPEDTAVSEGIAYGSPE